VTEIDNCEGELKATVAQEEKTITAVLIYLRKQIIFNKGFTKGHNYSPESHEELYKKSIAEVEEIARELGFQLPPL
jgi:hypothetical protein